MEFEKVKDLMKSLDNSNLMDFELKLNEGFYLRMNKYKTPANISNESMSNIVEEVAVKEKINSFKNIENKQEIIIEDKKELKGGSVVNSPIVGTFYSSASPNKPDFVKIGDKVSQGDTLCIVEAMKVMNEITSPYSGEVVEILVQNEDMVEYNQPLFRIV